MNYLSPEKKMTIKEVADSINVTPRTVMRHARNMGLTMNGKVTYLNEAEATEIKKLIEKSGRTDLDNVVELQKVNSDLEMAEKTQQVIGWLIQKKTEAENRLNRLIHNNRTYTTTELAKELGFRSAQELNGLLKDKGIQYKDKRGVWLMYAEYADKGFVEIKQDEFNGHVGYHRKWTGLGRDYLL